MRIRLKHRARGGDGKWFVLKTEYLSFTSIPVAVEWAAERVRDLHGHLISVGVHGGPKRRYWTAADVLPDGEVRRFHVHQWDNAA